MRSKIQRFQLRKSTWPQVAEFDFTETDCCILTGQNGGGKTLSIRLLELAGKWAANPSRFHFREMEKLAAKTDVVELSITVRSTIIQGRDKYVNALAWAAEFELDTDFFQTNARTAFSEYDYAIDTAQLVETTVYFEDAPRIQRRKKLELHYMARHHDYRDEEDVIFADHNPDFSPQHHLKLTEHYPEHVFEHATVVPGEWRQLSLGPDSELTIFEPNPHDVLHGITLLEHLTAHGIVMKSLEMTFPKTQIQLPNPVVLDVRRHIENVASDLLDIRSLDGELEKKEFVIEALQDGRLLHNQAFNTNGEISLIELDAEEGLDVFIDLEDLQPFEYHQITMSQPNFPAWLAFRRFLGHIPSGEYLSSGQLQLLAMTRAILASEYNALLMIDEPELSLHIDWQRGLIDFFRSTFPHHTFLISTHSPDILYHEVPLVVQIPPLEDES